MFLLKDAGNQPVGVVGGKAQALGKLIGMGACVPGGFVIEPGFDVRRHEDEVLDWFDEMACEYVAVRSSAAAEDGSKKSWAGQFESYLYVRRGELGARIADCRGSGNSVRAQAYDGAHARQVAVIVQCMVKSEVSGVCFTANPVTGNKDELMVEAVFGLGEQLVQGLATPDNYVIDKASGELKSQTVVTKRFKLEHVGEGIREVAVDGPLQDTPAIRDRQLALLVGLATQLEVAFGHALDIEWAVSKGQFYVLQARPITTLAKE